MHKPASEKDILEFIFSCNKRDVLLLGYLRCKHWTPAMGAMIACGVRPPPDDDNTIPPTGFGIDDTALTKESLRLKNARNLLANWLEDYEENGSPPPGKISPQTFIDWCVESGYITDWLRLIGSLYGGDIESGFLIANGGVSDFERLTILPRSLMSALIGTAQSTSVLDHTLREAVAPSTPTYLASPSTISSEAQIATHALSKRKPITSVIELARQKAEDPNNSEIVWIELIRLAKSNPPQKPLLEYIAGEGIKWIDEEKSDEEKIQILTKSLFERRLERYLTAATKKKKPL